MYVVAFLWDWITGHATVISAVVSAIAAAAIVRYTVRLTDATARQAKLTHDALALAQAEFNASHRPKIKVLSLELDWETLPDNEGLIDTSRTRLEGFIRFVNQGDGVAILKEFGSKLTLYPEQGLVFDRIDTGEARLASGEEGNRRITSGFRNFTSEYGKPTYCVGYILYEDAAGRARKTGFCWRLNTDSRALVRVEGSPYEYAY